VAETYKGLTIRIGGETTGLQRALKSADSAIASTNAQLRKMGQALRMDPSSTKAMNTQLELMGNKAVETSNRVAKLREAIRQVGDQKVELDFGDDNVRYTQKSIRELMEGTEDVSQRAADAAQRYNEVDAALERIYRDINKAAQASGKFSKDFDLRENVNQLDKIEGELISSGAATEDQITKLKALRAAWRDAFEENEIGKALTRVRDLSSELTKTEASARQAASQFVKLSLNASRVELSGDIDKQLERVDASAKEAAASLTRAQQALKIDPGSTDAAREAMRSLEESATLATKRLQLMEQKLGALDANGVGSVARYTTDAADAARIAAQNYEDVTVQLNKAVGKLSELKSAQQRMSDNGDTQSEGYRELSAQIERATDEVNRLKSAQMSARSAAETAQQVEEYRDLEGQIASTRAELKKYNDEAKSLTSPGKLLSSNTLMELGMTLSTSVTPAIVAMGSYAIEAATDIDSAYRDMRKTVNGTEDDFERLRQAAVDFSATHVTSADQILQIQAIGGELGVAVDDLETFSETVSNLDVATDLNAEDAATALGQLDNIMSDLDGTTMPAFSDALVRLGNNGASTESQIVEIAKRIGAMGSIVGMTTPEVLAWASSIASTGQNAEAAGTAISNTMSDLETAVAGGGEALEAFAQVSGMSAQQFADTWNGDPSTAMRAFIEGLVKIEEGGGSADATLQELGITAVRQKQAIEGLMQTIGGLDENLQMSNNAWNGVSDQWGEAGDAANEASKKAEGFSGSMSRMQNAAQVLASSLGESLAPAIDFIADVIGDLTVWFNSLPDSAKQTIAVIGGITAALGPFVLFARAFGSLSKDISSFTSMMKAASTATEAASGAMSGMSSAAGGLSGGLVALGVAVAAVGLTAFIQWCSDAAKNAENLEKATDGLAEATERAGNLGQLNKSITEYGDETKATAKGVNELAQNIADSVDRMNESTDAADLQISKLTEANRIIQQYAGQTDLTTNAQGQLQWALKTVNDELGTNITQNDVAAGTYTDVNGEVQNLTESLGNLIEAKKAEARVNSLMSDYEDAYSNQREALRTLEAEQKKYDDYYQKMLDRGKSEDEAKNLADKFMGDGLKNAQELADSTTATLDKLNNEIGEAALAASDAASVYDRLSVSMDPTKFNRFAVALEGNGHSFEQFSDTLEAVGAGTKAFSELSSDELERLADTFDGSTATMERQLAMLGVSTTKTRQQMTESFAQLGEEVPGYLESLGYNLDDLSGYLIMAGISTQDLANVGGAQLQAFAEAANGNIQGVVDAILGYNNTPFIDKNGNVTANYKTLYDANGQIYIWNGTQLKTITGDVIANAEDLPQVLEDMDLYEDTTLENKVTTVDTNYGGDLTIPDAKSQIDDLRRRGDRTLTTVLRTVYETEYRTKSTGGGSAGTLSGALSGHRSTPAPASYSALAAANTNSALNSGISLMSETSKHASSLAASARAAIAPIAARASDLAASLSITTERVSTSGSVRSLAHNMSRTPPYPGSGIREESQRAVNITIDGIGTTARVQDIALNLLDELERVGAI